MTALRAYREDLTDHLADGLGATKPKVGAQINPPAVVVQAGTPYVAAIDYCNDALLFQATIVAPPGDAPAVVDALDDLIDEIRSTLRAPSSGGHRYGFREVSEFTTWPQGDELLPAVVVTVAIERPAP